MKIAERKLPLIVLDLANNHNGSVDHAKKIIDELSAHVGVSKFDISVKFQYRNLDTFIHPDFQDRIDFKYIKRFQETKMADENFLEIIAYVREAGFGISCTPFDESSVSKVESHGFDFLKIASVSVTDWPLLERAVSTELPMVVSTAGANVNDLDRVVTFLKNRHKHFTLMHCVAAYPTPDSDLQLNRIDMLKNRYPGISVGYSTHESPDNVVAAAIAVAKGCEILERHLGLPTKDVPNNLYSSTPQQVGKWLLGLEAAIEMMGNTDGEFPINAAEREALSGLRRGVYVKTELNARAKLTNDQVFFAIPLLEGQLTANDWSKYLETETRNGITSDQPVMLDQVKMVNHQDEIESIVISIRQLLKESGVTIAPGTILEISHHYGIQRFSEFGLCMFTVVNRSYCKKLLFVLGGQAHPEQFHMEKEETFHLIHGDLNLELNGVANKMKIGDVVTIEPECRHAFSSLNGAVLEEISSNHNIADSFYTDDAISKNKNRKTFVTFWA